MMNLLLPSTFSFGQNATQPDTKAIAGEYLKFMSPPPNSPTSIRPSPMADEDIRIAGIDWEDVRVQSWSGPERQENGTYIEGSLIARKEIRNLEVSWVL
jgi:hypothetical protein